MNMRHKSSTALCSPLRLPGLSKVRSFLREEDGVLAKPMIGTFLAMLAVGGIGVDLMRMERDRTELQYTLDRAVLAAADLDQSLDADAVVLDYLTKADLEQYYSDPDDQKGLGYKSVEATINTDFEAYLLKFAGGDNMSLYANSRAEETIGSVEISMVLDISGSMNSGNRLVNLQAAAKSFVTQITSNTDVSNLSISIIPYATQVNAGKELLSKYPNVSQEHDYSYCVNFIKDQFSKHTLNQDENLIRTAHFDTFTYSMNMIDRPVCPTRPGSAILPFTNDAAKLHAYIDSLTASGNTSIDIGMKWGSALLDPTARGVVNALVDDGVIDASFRNRPTDYGSGDTLKIIILMSDGQNTNQYMINESRREGISDVWYNEEADVFSVYNPSGNNYYWYSKGWYSKGWESKGRWEDHRFGEGTYKDCYYCSEKEEPGTSERLTYQKLHARVSLASIARDLYRNTSDAWANWFTAGRYFHNRVAKDQHTKTICDITKDQGVIVYSVGFEAPSAGIKVLEDCASSPAHFFDVEGLEISDAFSSIATSIRQLRLTQ
ncbi:TadE/TadG family type IV pilus assembly protein [Leisingera daeponensis]|uniref:TadE/TadG family type IV pilus assembly protein n=1 Tax=Leisingera daeponensis TaxID=405746 RepID=UPI0004117A62|nr:TadE/TadG family type IV pilus assembly protein [Leisingera daeponensis]